MSSYTLNIQVEGGSIASDQRLLTADSVDYLKAAFTFDESWTELYKTAVFRVGELVYHTPLEQDSCIIPHEVLKEPMLYLSVFGVRDTTRATTAELPLQVQNSGYVRCEPSAPSPDPYNYFIEKATDIKNEAAEYASQGMLAAEMANHYTLVSQEIYEGSQQTKNEIALQKEAVLDAAKRSEDILNSVTEQAASVSEIGEKAQENAILAKEQADRAQATVMDEIENHNSAANDLAHPNILTLAEEAKSIALGKASSLCFDTHSQLLDWINGDFARADGKTINDLKTGDNLYIVDLSVPDYWWDGENIQPLGAERPDLSDYYTKSQIDARISDATFDLMGRSEYDALYSAGNLDAGRIYFVFEEE